ncbi:hypothetical protein [Pseudanabaena sp. FACHB-1998]|nr:hypothetical protein [Pseudanabaena sp. FACHB-1998]
MKRKAWLYIRYLDFVAIAKKFLAKGIVGTDYQLFSVIYMLI